MPFERLTTPADRLPGTSFDLIPESPKADGTSASTRGIFWRERSASPLSSAAQAEVLLSAGMMIATNGDLVGGQSNQSCTAMVYDAVGNILSKTGVGTYEYPGSAGGRTFRDGPRRIVTPSGAAVPMAYDAAGRLTQKGTQTFTYTSDGLLRTTVGALGLLSVRYEYGPSGERVLEEGWHGETRSVGGLYQRTTSKSDNRVPRTLNVDTVMTSFLIPADGRIVAEVRFHDDPLRLSMVGVNAGQQPWTSGSFATPALDATAREQVSTMAIADSYSVYYLHPDHLGSPNVVTDAYGTVVERRSYSAFGQLRSPDWLAGKAPPAYGSRIVGYTGHEDDSESGLVNMGGRIYDPTLARFLTPDPFVQAPNNAQSLHRFAYVWNSPLSRVDPTGFVGEGVGDTAGPDGAVITVQLPPPASASRPLDPQLSPGSDAPGVTIAPGETVDGTRVDPAAPIVPLDPDVDRDRYGRMHETHRGIIERFVEPIVPWVILLDPDRGPYVNPGTKARLLQQAFGDIVITIILPGSKATTAGVEAAEAAAIRLNPAVKITQHGLQHVVDRHTHNGLAKFANKSKFNVGESVEELIRAATQQPMSLQPNGRFARTVNMLRDIGIDRATGSQTSVLTVITELDGTLVTAFPGLP